MLKGWLIFYLLIAMPLPAWAASPVAVSEVPAQVVSGNFTGSGVPEQILLRVLPTAAAVQDLPVDYPTHKVDRIYKSSGEWLAVQHISRDGAGHVASTQVVTLDETIQAYDIMEFNRVCRDPDSGLDQVLLTLGKLGTSNGNVDDTLFLHSSSASQQLTATLVASMFVDNCSLQQSLANRDAHLQQRADGLQLYERLKPADPFELADDLPQPLLLPHQTFSGAQVSALKDELAALDKRCRWYANLWGDEEQKQHRYYFELLSENQRWQVYAAYYSELWHAWGVLLAHDRQLETWHSFYTIPAGGSRVLLYLSDYFELHDNQLKLALCKDCDWWGRYEDVTINLEDFSLRRGP